MIDTDAERNVVASLMLAPNPADECEAIAQLRPEAFTSPAFAAVFCAVVALHDEGARTIDETIVPAKMAQLGTLEAAGGKEVVSRLVDYVPTSANLKHHVAVVRAHWQRRRIMELGNVAKRFAEDIGTKPSEALAKLSAMAAEIELLADSGGAQTMRQLVAAEFAEIDRRHKAGEESLGLSTGLAEVDSLIGGLAPEDLVIIAGRPSMGKTALALQIATHNGARAGKQAAVFSLEMSSAALARRALSEFSRIPTTTMRQPRMMRDADWPRLASAMGALSTDAISVVDRAGISIREIHAHAMRQKAKRGLDLVVIDYLQLVRPAYRSGSREQDVAEISRGAKLMAKELHVPVIMLAQLNRENEKRGDKRPLLSDLRESGSIEQDADMVLLVHRDSYYDTKQPANEADVIVAKQRNGDTGTAHLGWDGQSTRFYSRGRG